jgi:hypothetical protein
MTVWSPRGMNTLPLIRSKDAKMQVDNPQETVEMIKHGEIDESLYSRQL